MLTPAQDSSSFIHMKTVSDTAGLGGFPELKVLSLLVSLTSFEYLSKKLR